MGRRAFSYERLDVPRLTFSQKSLRIHARDKWPEAMRQLADDPAEGQRGDDEDSDGATDD